MDDKSPTLSIPLSRTFFLNGEVDNNEVIKFAEFIRANRKTKEDLWVCINSSGGFTSAAFNFIGLMETSGLTINTYVIGEAFSGAFLIAIAGNRRFASPFCEFMSHDVRNVDDNSDAHSPIDERVDPLGVRYKTLIRKHVGKYLKPPKYFPRSNFHNFHDTFFTPEEAVEYNVVESLKFFKFV